MSRCQHRDASPVWNDLDQADDSDDSVVYAYGPRGALTQTVKPRTRCCGRWVGDCDCSDKRMEARL